jgi:hypothetical protein
MMSSSSVVSSSSKSSNKRRTIFPTVKLNKNRSNSCSDNDGNGNSNSNGTTSSTKQSPARSTASTSAISASTSTPSQVSPLRPSFVNTTSNRTRSRTHSSTSTNQHQRLVSPTLPPPLSPQQSSCASSISSDGDHNDNSNSSNNNNNSSSHLIPQDKEQEGLSVINLQHKDTPSGLRSPPLLPTATSNGTTTNNTKNTAPSNSTKSKNHSSSNNHHKKKMTNKNGSVNKHQPRGQRTTTTATQPSKGNTLEKRLFHALHTSQVNSPDIKEFKECWAFSNAVKTYFRKDDIELVLDVAGGHGALGALLLTLLPSTSSSVVIDPAHIKGGVELAWGDIYKQIPKQENSSTTNNNNNTKKKELRYRHECLRTGLHQELDDAINRLSISPKKILVVACHACQHLSDETLEIACSFGVHIAVMPCCHKDLSGGSFKAFGKQIQMNIGVLMDVLTAGKVMSWNNGKESRTKYQVKMKMIDEKITPQNRIILCKARNWDNDDSEKEKIKQAHKKLSQAYHRAHGNAKKSVQKLKKSVCVKSLGVGLMTGILVSFACGRKRIGR